jgi:hypothetical protein
MDSIYLNLDDLARALYVVDNPEMDSTVYPFEGDNAVSKVLTRHAKNKAKLILKAAQA